jgi:hypothetical protein
VFAAHEVTVEAGFQVAAARLAHVVSLGALHGVSVDAYEGGLDATLRVGPFGQLPGLSKLVRVRALEPVRRGAALTVSLRWEATGAAGELFPVLDADLTLLPAGPDQSLVGLVGSYRPPLGRAGAILDRAIMSRIATATLSELLERIAIALAHPREQPRLDADPARRWLPLPESGRG